MGIYVYFCPKGYKCYHWKLLWAKFDKQMHVFETAVKNKICDLESWWKLCWVRFYLSLKLLKKNWLVTITMFNIEGYSTFFKSEFFFGPPFRWPPQHKAKHYRSNRGYNNKLEKAKSTPEIKRNRKITHQEEIYISPEASNNLISY